MTKNYSEARIVEEIIYDLDWGDIKPKFYIKSFERVLFDENDDYLHDLTISYDFYSEFDLGRGLFAYRIATGITSCDDNFYPSCSDDFEKYPLIIRCQDEIDEELMEYIQVAVSRLHLDPLHGELKKAALLFGHNPNKKDIQASDENVVPFKNPACCPEIIDDV